MEIQAPPSRLLTAADGRPIVELRTSDGYVNATRMCQAAGKRWFNFANLDGTSTYISYLNAATGIAATDLLQSGHQGTWVHPQVAIKLAAWCSPQFELAVTDLVLRYSRGEVTTEESRQVAAGLQAASLVPSTTPAVTLPGPTQLPDASNKRGLYLGRPNGRWSQLTTPGQVAVQLPEQAVVLKFGCTDDGVERVKSHRNQYKGFQLLSWQPSDDSRMGEASFRARLQLDNRLVQGVNENKGTKDTELVIVQSEAEYMELQQLMTGFADAAPAGLSMEEIKLKQLELTEPTRRLELQNDRLRLEFEVAKWRVQHHLPVA